MPKIPQYEYTVTRHDGLKTEVVLADSYHGLSGMFQFLEGTRENNQAVALIDRVSTITRKDNPAVAKAKAEADKLAKKEAAARAALVGKPVQVDLAVTLDHVRGRLDRYIDYSRALRSALVEAQNLAYAGNRFGHRAETLEEIGDIDVPELPVAAHQACPTSKVVGS